jgi:hypothetical protein
MDVLIKKKEPLLGCSFNFKDSYSEKKRRLIFKKWFVSNFGKIKNLDDACRARFLVDRRKILAKTFDSYKKDAQVSRCDPRKSTNLSQMDRLYSF